MSGLAPIMGKVCVGYGGLLPTDLGQEVNKVSPL